MANVALTVDTVGKKLQLQFEDDHGDVTGAPDGAIVTFSNDNPAALTLAADPNDPTGLTQTITVVAEGVANLGVKITDASGAPLARKNPDGTDAGTWTDPSPVAVTVGAGPAEQAVLTVD